jgi:uncharacterized membrane protein YoaK (UPF0700 family)
MDREALSMKNREDDVAHGLSAALADSGHAGVGGKLPAARAELPMAVSLRRVVALAGVAGYVEVIGFMDFGGIYPAIMTGNTVQLGLTVAHAQWARFALIGFAVGMFFLGGIIASLIKVHLKRPPVELLLMAVLLCIASVVRMHSPNRLPFELPLLAFALAMQGETVSRFGGISLQTIVVTNNMVKFCDALVGRYFYSRREPGGEAKRTPLMEMVLPGAAWLTYSVCAGLGAVASIWFQYALVVPAVVLVGVCGDLLFFGRGDK